jgi:MinD superfamily P-loop ATPase
MIIAVAGGKGGTGKTTIAVNLALSLLNENKEIQFLDCDVEEPDAHLFLKGMKLKKIEDVTLKIPIINQKKCTHCGKCSKFCEYNALAVIPQEVILFKELCHGCGLCSLVCKEGAIKEGERNIGRIEKGKFHNLEFFQGVLNIGEAMATPIIAELKRKINSEKEVILDLPPGTACPIIEALDGVDFCILVTEPTPFGLHDLKLAVNLARILKIKFGVIINRDGIGDEKVEKYCNKENIEILMKIPHDENIAMFCSEGIAFIEKMPEWKEKFLEIFEDIEKIKRER